MPMDWSQDPHLQRLEEKLDRVLELLERESKTNHSIPNLFSFEECKEVLQCSDRTLRYYLPGGKRVSRAAGEKKIEARKLMFEKEQNLRNGIFLMISTLSESLIQ